jgi:pimeloyl-ACP methyl ester carboxylesterase
LSEKTWGETNYYPEMLRTYWKEQHWDAPRVIAVSFGPQWLLVDKNSSPMSGLLDLFMTRAIAFLEKKTGPVWGRRLLVGESMGGFNASVVAFKKGKFFSKAAILCPAITKVTPFSTSQEIDDYIQRTGATRRLVEGIQKLSLAFFPDPQSWKAGSPLELLASHSSQPLPILYMSCGLRDEYGFYEGVSFFVKESRKKGIGINWNPLYAGHCGVDIKSLAQFLIF